jgi:hypothetical protein
MYAALWRALPGPTAVRILLLVILLGLVLTICDLWLFPWIGAMIGDDNTGAVGVGEG